jgi:hypothetical protein
MAAVGRYAPPLALMGLIFFLSAQADLTAGVGWVDELGSRVAHFAEFGLLFWLCLRAFAFRRAALAAGITILYAASDEYHQRFVTGRNSDPVDFLVDCAGVAAVWALHEWLRRSGRRRSDPAALGGDEDGLGPVDRAELPVDVVEVGADRAGGER